MRVFLCFCDANLAQIQAGKVFAQGAFQRGGRIDNLQAREGLVILGHGDIAQGKVTTWPLKAGEVLHDESAGNLTHAVGPEVKADHAVFRLNPACRLAVLHEHDGLDKLVCDAVFIAVIHRLHRVSGGNAGTQHHGIVAQFDALPDVVAVHAPVTALNAGDLPHAQAVQFFLQLAHIAHAAGWRYIASVQQCVHEKAGQPARFGHVQQGKEVFDVAVDAAVRQQAHEVQGLVVFARFIHGPDERFLAQQFTGFDIPGNLHQLLVDDTPGADVEMTHLRVAHLSGGQPHVRSGSRQLGVGIDAHEAVKVGGSGFQNGVAKGVGIDPKAIHDNQCSQLFGHVFSFINWICSY